MNTNEHYFSFQVNDVQQFVTVLGDQNPIYSSVEVAQSHGYKTIPLPPTMPMIIYKKMDIPWDFHPPIIHRKQQFSYVQVMYIDQTYKSIVALTDVIQRKDRIFIKQELQIMNTSDEIVFKGTAHLIVGGIIEKN